MSDRRPRFEKGKIIRANALNNVVDMAGGAHKAHQGWGTGITRTEGMFGQYQSQIDVDPRKLCKIKPGEAWQYRTTAGIRDDVKSCKCRFVLWNPDKNVYKDDYHTEHDIIAYDVMEVDPEEDELFWVILNVQSGRWETIAGGDTALKFGRITGMAASAIAAVEVCNVANFALSDYPVESNDNVSGSRGDCPPDDEVDTNINGRLGGYLGEPTGETVYAWVGGGISQFYSTCDSTASGDEACGCIVIRTPWSFLRAPASGSASGPASGGMMREPMYACVECDHNTTVRSWDIIDCCGSDVDSGVLEKIGEMQLLMLAKIMCCQVGECGDQASGCAT